MNRIIRRSVILAALLGGFSSCGHPPRIDEVVLKEDSVTLGPEWIVMSLPQVVTVKWKVQSVRMEAYPSQDSFPKDLSDHFPEIELITTDGAAYLLGDRVLRGPQGIHAESDRIPTGTNFAELRMRFRSSKPLIISKITWVSYMPEDFKAARP